MVRSAESNRLGWSFDCRFRRLDDMNEQQSRLNGELTITIRYELHILQHDRSISAVLCLRTQANRR